VDFGFGSDGLGQVNDLHARVGLRLIHPHDRLVGQDKDDSSISSTQVSHRYTWSVIDSEKFIDFLYLHLKCFIMVAQCNL